eukprot:GHUV01019669.1.p1 GENE.GHUV01019669.1~~GHUV01019669.1.p1  ORF type:complete len:206 (-),score=30.61 GHUV01019669.1:1093-1710(-)
MCLQAPLTAQSTVVHAVSTSMGTSTSKPAPVSGSSEPWAPQCASLRLLHDAESTACMRSGRGGTDSITYTSIALASSCRMYQPREWPSMLLWHLPVAIVNGPQSEAVVQAFACGTATLESARLEKVVTVSWRLILRRMWATMSGALAASSVPAVLQVAAEGRRNKVPLEKGFSQVDWLRVSRSGAGGLTLAATCRLSSSSHGVTS